jgi:hypothetical protein
MLGPEARRFSFLEQEVRRSGGSLLEEAMRLSLEQENIRFMS